MIDGAAYLLCILVSLCSFGIVFNHSPHAELKLWHSRADGTFSVTLMDSTQPHLAKLTSAHTNIRKSKFHPQVIPLDSLTELVLTLVTIRVGSKQQPFNLVVDTGSSAVLIPAKDCNGCNVAVGFDIKQSKTHHAVGCKFCDCDYLCGDCKPGSHNCSYLVNFVDGTGAHTQLIEDQVVMENSTIRTNVTLAVMHEEIATKKVHLTTNNTEGTHIDGVLGLVNSSSFCDNLKYDHPLRPGCQPINWVSAMWRQHNMSRQFSLYVGDYNYGGEGRLWINNKTIVAEAEGEDTQWVPMEGGFYYSVNLNGLELEGQPVMVDAGNDFGSTIVDSGTNAIVLATAAYQKLKRGFIELYADLPAVSMGHAGMSLWDRSTCLVADKIDITRFPPITFVFDDVKLEIPPERYFTLMKDKGGLKVYCLSILDAKELNNDPHTSILGQSFMSSYITTFDVERERIGFKFVPVPVVEHQVQLMLVVSGSIIGLVIMIGFFIQQYLSVRKAIYRRIRDGMPEVRQVMQGREDDDADEDDEEEGDADEDGEDEEA
eukprot:TRINITY_DN47519_c0_g1_i1.p1 TRINITY_DN47519_c0_g1~~TRINITY_DN47519_c0_g1_i1.p1  ORF type:complete len:543 (-),score=56.74 TRINITY_DN47519_c0_g1_i1:1416-3044(-)